jgi:hypothetical protein
VKSSRLGLLVTVTLAARAWGGTGVPDSQLWSELDLIAPTSANTFITGIGQARFSESVPNPTYSALGLEFNYKNRDLTLTGGYRHQVTGHKTDEPKVTQLALLMGTYAPRFGRSTVALRLRIENTITASGNPWRVRMRAEYRYALADFGPVTYAYTSDEVFYQFQQSEWYRNRFQAGVNLKFGRRWNVLGYFQRQDDRLNHPGAINALGFTMKYAFD